MDVCLFVWSCTLYSFNLLGWSHTSKEMLFGKPIIELTSFSDQGMMYSGSPRFMSVIIMQYSHNVHYSLHQHFPLMTVQGDENINLVKQIIVRYPKIYCQNKNNRVCFYAYLIWRNNGFVSIFFSMLSIGFLKPVSWIRWIKELFGRFVILQFCEYKPSLIKPET